MTTKDQLLDDIRAHTDLRKDGALPSDLYYEFHFCIGEPSPYT